MAAAAVCMSSSPSLEAAEGARLELPPTTRPPRRAAVTAVDAGAGTRMEPPPPPNSSSSGVLSPSPLPPPSIDFMRSSSARSDAFSASKSACCRGLGPRFLGPAESYTHSRPRLSQFVHVGMSPVHLRRDTLQLMQAMRTRSRARPSWVSAGWYGDAIRSC